MLSDHLLPLHDATAILKNLPTFDHARTEYHLEHTHHHVLADDLYAKSKVPPFDNVAVDGWACRFDPKMGKFQRFRFEEGRAAAGHPYLKPVRPGHALRVLTGAPLPPACDTVFLQEEVYIDPQGLTAPEKARTGDHIRKAGEDVQQGELLFKKGHRFRPQDLGILAQQGMDKLFVSKPLKTALYSTGDELINPGQPVRYGQIYDANQHILSALLKLLPVQAAFSGKLPDDEDRFAKILQQSASQSDIIITSGGASRGDEDHLERFVRRAGEVLFWRIAVKPGRPFGVGRVGGSYVIGLPGNPVAAALCFAMIVRPFLLHLTGAGWHEPSSQLVRLGMDFRKKEARTEWVRVKKIDAEHGPELHKIGKQGSGVLSSLVQADGIAILNHERQLYEKGENVPFISLHALGLGF